MKNLFSLFIVCGIFFVQPLNAHPGCGNKKCEPKLNPFQPITNDEISEPISFPPPRIPNSVSENGTSKSILPPITTPQMESETPTYDSPQTNMAENNSNTMNPSSEEEAMTQPCPRCGKVHNNVQQGQPCPKCGKIHSNNQQLQQQQACPKCGKVHGDSSQQSQVCPRCGQVHANSGYSRRQMRQARTQMGRHGY